MPGSDAINAIRAFKRTRVAAAVERIEPIAEIEGAMALFTPSLPRVRELNVVLAPPCDDPASIERLFNVCERVQGELAHRTLRMLDGGDEAALRHTAQARGWRVDRDLVMVHAREPDRRDSHDAVTDVDREAVAASSSLSWSRDPEGRDPETRRQLAAQYDRWERAPLQTRRLGVVENGRVVAWCRVFDDGQVAEIDDVLVLHERRGAGLGRMVVQAAIASVPPERLLFLCADPDDWPRELYERLGFDSIGDLLGATRPPADG